MTQPKSIWIFSALVFLIAAGCYGAGGTGGRCCPGDGAGTSAAGGLPDHVWAAAVKAVPGLVLDEWETETTPDGVLVYDIEGAAYGEEFELEVTADGTVLEVEKEGPDDDDDGDDDDDDGDDDGERDD